MGMSEDLGLPFNKHTQHHNKNWIAYYRFHFWIAIHEDLIFFFGLNLRLHRCHHLELTYPQAPMIHHQRRLQLLHQKECCTTWVSEEKDGFRRSKKSRMAKRKSATLSFRVFFFADSGPRWCFVERDWWRNWVNCIIWIYLDHIAVVPSRIQELYHFIRFNNCWSQDYTSQKPLA